MKKHTIITIAILAAAVFGACDGEPAAPGVLAPGNTASEASAPAMSVDEASAVPGEAGFEFIYKGNAIVLGSKADDFIAKAGAPKDVFEAPSCAFEGIDKILYYPGFIINTYPIDGTDYILSVVLGDDSLTTPEGVYLGMGADEIPDVYGPVSEKENALIYKKGGTTLTFITENGAVADITYYYEAAISVQE
ncbi:MAG: hypothetical protein LBN97_08350 [Oscillospiraceae bacterium]|nr:hypothetical protein [Oscillospiraceae bacterium]